ncbi:hypothetical protein V5O48_015269 [Marasmius crinis-equi]|uniref:Uncharacterized protein n=1 Tax=Marasmius crinis-equi TaxID=585013 RepID=A0ABR3EUZ2_9AGAR
MSDVPAKRPASDSSSEGRNVRQKFEVKIEVEEAPAPAAGIPAEIWKLQKKSEELQKINQDYLNAIAKASNKVAQERDEAAARMQSLETEVTAMKGKIRELESKHEEKIRRTSEKFDSEKERWSQGTEDLENKLKDVKGENKRLKAELEKLKEWRKKVHSLVFDESTSVEEDNTPERPVILPDHVASGTPPRDPISVSELRSPQPNFDPCTGSVVSGNDRNGSRASSPTSIPSAPRSLKITVGTPNLGSQPHSIGSATFASRMKHAPNSVAASLFQVSGNENAIKYPNGILAG